MASARDTFLRDLEAIATASDSSTLFVEPAASESQASAARLLRNGLAVVSFNSLEHFIDRRSVELLTMISAAPITFGDLPHRWKEAATRQVVAALSASVRLMQKNGEDPTPLIQETGVALASTRGATLTLSSLALRWTGSNLTQEDISRSLRVLQIEEPWSAMTAIANRAGFGLLGNSEDVFRSLLRARNEAAHEPLADTSILYLRSLRRTVAAVAFAFDALASRAARLAATGDPAYLLGRQVRESGIRLRYLDSRGNRWAEVREGNPAIAYRLHADYDAARREALLRACREREVVVARDGAEPLWWATGDAA
jgi:hypothetical protein